MISAGARAVDHAGDEAVISRDRRRAGSGLPTSRAGFGSGDGRESPCCCVTRSLLPEPCRRPAGPAQQSIAGESGVGAGTGLRAVPCDGWRSTLDSGSCCGQCDLFRWYADPWAGDRRSSSVRMVGRDDVGRVRFRRPIDRAFGCGLRCLQKRRGQQGIRCAANPRRVIVGGSAPVRG